jgi:glyoxylate utilization-related uncharacterized protein
MIMSTDETESAHAGSAQFEEMTPEQKESFFAQIGSASSQVSPDGFEFFAFVVDGKVSVVFVASKASMQKEITAWSSNPTVVKLSDAQKLTVLENWDYDAQTGEFSASE